MICNRKNCPLNVFFSSEKPYFFLTPFINPKKRNQTCLKSPQSRASHFPNILTPTLYQTPKVRFNNNQLPTSSNTPLKKKLSHIIKPFIGLSSPLHRSASLAPNHRCRAARRSFATYTAARRIPRQSARGVRAGAYSSARLSDVNIGFNVAPLFLAALAPPAYNPPLSRPRLSMKSSAQELDGHKGVGKKGALISVGACTCVCRIARTQVYIPIEE